MTGEKKESSPLFTAIRGFFKNRLYTILAIAVLVVALAGGVYSIYLLRDQTAEENLSSADGFLIGTEETDNIVEVVEVLPQQKRNLENDSESSSWNAFEPVIDPFAGPMKLTGILLGGFNDSMAIIESSGMAYIVSVGDYIDDVWAVREIGREMVILRAHNLEVSLFLDQPPSTRTLDGDLDPGQEEDDPEEGA